MSIPLLAFLPFTPLLHPRNEFPRINHPHRSTDKCPLKASANAHTTVLIVPTGIGAAIGGYAGDALPCARLLSSVTDTLITHPNVLNGALMYWPLPNALYVEGYALDQFAAGNYTLQPLGNTTNTIGLLFDAAVPPEARLRHIQAAEASQATLGLSVSHTTTTSEPLHVTLAASPSGASWGHISNPGALLHAAQELLSAGCNAIAVVAEFPDEDDEHLSEYRAGCAVDAIAGAEAVISHLLTRELGVPCAHAPSLPPLPADDAVSPKAAAEELGYTFLTCVLVGLANAPRIATAANTQTGIVADDVDVVVVPADAFGGGALMSLAGRKDVLIIAVSENSTALDVGPRAVGIDPSRVLIARSYAEAAGFIAAHKAGINIASLGRNVPRLEQI